MHIMRKVTNTTMETCPRKQPILKSDGSLSATPGSCINRHNRAVDTAGNNANLGFLAAVSRINTGASRPRSGRNPWFGPRVTRTPVPTTTDKMPACPGSAAW